MSASWFRVTIDVPTHHAEALATFLIDSGAPGLQLEEHAESTTLIAYFSENPPLGTVRDFCSTLLQSAPNPEVPPINVAQVADEDWAESWKEHCQPQVVGQRLFVGPSWNCTAPPGRIAVQIDPGMAFGTGQHATTRGCLEFIERATATRTVTRSLDAGTGSGVLAIALAKLGVSEVWAVDNDPLACTIACRNIRQNGVAATVNVVEALETISGTFDLIAANLFANLLQELASVFAARLREQGSFICSGFLVADEARIIRTYGTYGLVSSARLIEDSWVTLFFEHDPHHA